MTTRYTPDGERWEPEVQNKRRFGKLSYRNVGNVGNGGAA